MSEKILEKLENYKKTMLSVVTTNLIVRLLEMIK